MAAALSDRAHRVWWLGFWPADRGVAWWLTYRRLGGTGPAVTAPPVAGFIPATTLAEPLDILDRSLAARRPDEKSAVAALARAWGGALATPDQERELSVRLGRLLIPYPLRTHLAAVDPADGHDMSDTVVIATGPTLAHVPFELLVVDPDRDRRLVETCRIRGGLSAASGLGARVSRRPGPGPVVRVIDPGPAAGAAAVRGGLYEGGVPAPIYPSGVDERWFDRLADQDALLNGTERATPVTRQELSKELTERNPARMLFFGHTVSGQPGAPSAAGLVLSDQVDGGGPYRPLTAADWIREPDRWPAPPLTAFVSCHSNDTHLHEQMGLVQAALYTGSVLVTSTRWVLPADGGTPGGGTGTTELALAIDDAHGASDPIDALRRWQLTRLAAWRSAPGPQTAPLIWASPVTYQRGPLIQPVHRDGP